MRIQASKLYLLDERNRMLAVNEPDPPPAPRLFLGRTLEGDIWLFRHDLPKPLNDTLETLLRAEPAATDLAQPPRCLAAVQAALAIDNGSSTIETGPAWRFPDDLPSPQHAVIPITAANEAVVRDVFPVLADHLPWRQPCLAIVADGRLASICYSARNSIQAAEAGVDTLEPFRGRGYAASVAATWASAVRAEGRIPLYSTSWHNVASQSVARKLGLILYGEDLVFE